MVRMTATLGRTAFLALGLVAGLPWLRSSSTVPAKGEPVAASHAGAAPASRIVLVSSDAPEYRALAIPKSYKSDTSATQRLLVFRDGLCVRDRGIVTTHTTANGGSAGSVVMEETGITERAAVAGDEGTAVIASTHYVSRVDMTPGTTSTVNDTVRGATILTLVDAAHPDGRWQITIENGRWVKDLVALPGGAGLAVSTFLPRTGPSDLRLLDASGHERVHVPESTAETLRIEASPDGGFVAAELAFPDGATWERGVTVFGVAASSQWTYGWRYGGEQEPTGWTLEARGTLAVELASGTRRFDPTGRHR
jgi:hypothetical protein